MDAYCAEVHKLENTFKAWKLIMWYETSTWQ